MKSMRKAALAAALTLGVGLGLVGTASAQIPVTDAAENAQTLANQIANYAQYVEQVAQLKSQLEQAKQQYGSITGSRGMGALTQENYSSKIPTSWQETLALTQSQSAAGSLAKQITDEESQLGMSQFANVDPGVKTALQGSMNSAASQEGLNAQELQNADARFQRLQGMLAQIDSATDLKAISDLQARIQIESAEMQNELLRLQASNSMVTSNQEVIAQKSLQADFTNSTATY